MRAPLSNSAVISSLLVVVGQQENIGIPSEAVCSFRIDPADRPPQQGTESFVDDNELYSRHQYVRNAGARFFIAA